MDHFVKTVTSFYVCMGNMIRHVVVRQQGLSVAINLATIKVDELCKGTKKVAQRVYNLINYIDGNIQLTATEPTRKRNRKADNLVGIINLPLIKFNLIVFSDRLTSKKSFATPRTFPS